MAYRPYKCPPKPCPPPPKPGCSPCDGTFDGMSLVGAVQCLDQKVDGMMGAFNDVMEHNYETLHRLERCGEAVGAFYDDGEIFVQEGYNGDEGSAYTVIKKATVDKCNEPIFMELVPAYDNLTNSRLEENEMYASKRTAAQIMFPAVDVTGKGWFGHTIINGCKVVSSVEPDLFTVGFTRGGVMRIYKNSQAISVLMADDIVNSIGCYGAPVINGVMQEANDYVDHIPDRDVQKARILMGQNLNTREVWLLVTTVDEKNHGLTTKTAAQILLDFGCSNVVEIISGDNAAMMNRGGFVYAPTSLEIPEMYAYWYITRSRHYCNDYTRELNELYQNYGYNTWETFLSAKRLDEALVNQDDVNNAFSQRMDEIVKNYQAADAAIQDKLTQVESNLSETINRVQSNLDTVSRNLSDRLDAEEEARIAGDNANAAEIKSEIAKVTDSITEVKNDLTAETTNRINGDEENKNLIDAERSDREAAISQVKEEGKAYIDAQDAAIRAEMAQNMQTGKDYVDNAVNNLNQSIDNVKTEGQAYIDGQVQNLTTRIDNEVATRTSADTDLGARIDNLYTHVENTNAAISARLDTEITARANGDAAEIIARTQADDALSDRIDALSGEVENAVESQKNYLPLAGGQMQGDIDFAYHNIFGISTIGMTDPTGAKGSSISYDGSAVRVTQSEAGSVTPVRITNVADPIEGSDAATMSWVEEQMSGHLPADQFLPIVGGTMQGPIYYNKPMDGNYYLRPMAVLAEVEEGVTPLNRGVLAIVL